MAVGAEADGREVDDRKSVDGVAVGTEAVGTEAVGRKVAGGGTRTEVGNTVENTVGKEEADNIRDAAGGGKMVVGKNKEVAAPDIATAAEKFRLRILPQYQELRMILNWWMAEDKIYLQLIQHPMVHLLRCSVDLIGPQ